MAYIKLNELTNKSNENYDLEFSNKEFKFHARKVMVIELQLDKFVFSNVVLNAGDSVSCTEGDKNLLVENEYGKVVGQKLVDFIEREVLASGINYQLYYPEEKFALVPHLYYNVEERLEMVSFRMCKNAGLLKPGLTRQTISINLNKKSPLVGLLKEARKQGYDVVNLELDGLYGFKWGEIPTELKGLKGLKKVQKMWENTQGTEKRPDKENLLKFGIK